MSLLNVCVIVCLCVCMCVCMFVHVYGVNVWFVAVYCLYGNVVSGFKLFTDLFTCQAYVQNDICDDGKEIAEAEDWESTVKENRVRT